MPGPITVPFGSFYSCESHNILILCLLDCFVSLSSVLSLWVPPANFRLRQLLGGGCYIPHFNGIVVSPYARIGANVKILQQVTIGVDFDKDPFAAPKVGNGVLLGAGAKIIGDVDLGDDCKVGANAVVTRDVPVGKTVIGANNIV